MSEAIEWDIKQLIITINKNVMDHKYYENLRPQVLKLNEEKKNPVNIILDLSNVSFCWGDWNMVIMQDLLKLIKKPNGQIDIICNDANYNLYYDALHIDFFKQSLYKNINIKVEA